MIALEMLSWWYRRGWSQVAKNSVERFDKISRLFSVPILIRTWFAPWRRIITYPGAGIEAQLRAMADNLVSRMVGFTVRSLVLLTAGLMLMLSGVLTVIQLILWPLLPILGVGGIIMGCMAL